MRSQERVQEVEAKELLFFVRALEGLPISLSSVGFIKGF